MIYLDYAATAPVRSQVLQAMRPYWNRSFAHPSSISSAGRVARQAVERERHVVAAIIHASPEEIFFTSGASESILLAARMSYRLAMAARPISGPALVAALDHEIVHRALIDVVTSQTIQLIPSTATGLIDLGSLDELLRQSAVWWVSLPLVSSDLGTIQPVLKVGRLLRRRSTHRITPYVHLDASQAIGQLPIDVRKLTCDFLSFGGAKIGGPKGVGVLFARRATVLQPWRQQRELIGATIRPGTEAVPLIVGLGTALAIADRDRPTESARLGTLRDGFETQLLRAVPKLRILGLGADRTSHISSLFVPDMDAEALLIYLDHDGLLVGMGPACQSAADRPSSALESLGLSTRDRRSVIRVSLGFGTTAVQMTRATRIFINRIGWLGHQWPSSVDNST